VAAGCGEETGLVPDQRTRVEAELAPPGQRRKVLAAELDRAPPNASS